MTANTTQTRDNVQAPMSREEVKQMLRDAAFVLHLTKRVRCEMEAARPETVRAIAASHTELAAELGV